MNEATLADCVMELLREGGRDGHTSGAMTLLEHSLQAAALAEQSGAPDSLVVAALLHDIGHVLGTTGSGRGYDASIRHETLAAAWLSIGFSRAVTQPIRLHVAAKRFFSAVERDYTQRLSAAARESLPRQGGPMTDQELDAFRGTLWARDALVLRRWDDAATVPGRRCRGSNTIAPVSSAKSSCRSRSLPAGEGVAEVGCCRDRSPARNAWPRHHGGGARVEHAWVDIPAS